MEKLFLKAAPYAFAFISALVITLILVPLVRRLNIRLGMIDRPDPRRINTVSIPRGGGIALIAGVLIASALYFYIFGKSSLMSRGMGEGVFFEYAVLSLLVGAIGFVDDCFGMKPKIKFLCQILVASFAWWWTGIGFADLFPAIPSSLDCVLTVFWLVGAINAFNLIDGLDGLASGLALIASVGMAGVLLLCDGATYVVSYVIFSGALLGFLRYNYNPASIFLGDAGSMFIGFTLAFLMLVSDASNSMFVSLGVPILAMGVPIFDTFLAILRRTLRHMIHRCDSSENSNGRIMTADTDHLHHRILRSVGFNQRKAAWILYIMSSALVVFGISVVVMESRVAGLWLFAFLTAAVVALKDMARVELLDFGRFLNMMARRNDYDLRRAKDRFSVPALILADVILLSFVFLFCSWVLRINVGRIMLGTGMPLSVFPVFLLLVFMRIYSVVWSRATISDYLRLLVACVVGGILGSVAVYYSPAYNYQLKAMTVMYPVLSFVAISLLRISRSFLRDLFYHADCSRLEREKKASRVLVYGSGLRYKAFRRELVRGSTVNDRFIVGLIDDDIFLDGRCIGGVKVFGPFSRVREVIEQTRADALVIACVLPEEKLKNVCQVLSSTGIKFSIFNLNEVPLGGSAAN